MRVMTGLVVMVLVGGTGVTTAAPGGFVFTPPPGWVDVSVGAPQADRDKAPPQILAVADSHAFVAVALDSADDGFMEHVNASVQTGMKPAVMTMEVLAELEAGANKEFAKRDRSFRALKREIVKVAGVTAGRLVGDLQTPQATIRIVQYSIPGHGAYALLTFSTTPDNFERYQPIFEASAQATRGAVEPRAGFAMNWGSVARSGIIGGIAGGLAVLLVALIKRKRSTGRAT